MTPLFLFLHNVDGYLMLPSEWRATLKAFVPEPAPNALVSAPRGRRHSRVRSEQPLAP